MRGEVIDYAKGSGGLIGAEDGKRYSFTDDAIARAEAFAGRGATVDFVPEGETATQIYPLASSIRPFESTNEDLDLWGYFRKCMRLYANGEGRARRKEFWSFVLFTWLIAMGAAAVVAILCVPFAAAEGAGNSGASVAIGLLVVLAVLGFLIAFLPPHFAVLSRRLHDVNMSGWFALLSLIPYLGGLFVLVIALIPSQEAVNRYGAYPKPRAPYPV